MTLSYMHGFGGTFESEVVAGALPKKQNSPQKVPFDLYSEQLSGSAFTAVRHANVKSWLYRILPSVKHNSDFTLIKNTFFRSAPLNETITPPEQMRWDPLPIPEKPTDFIQSIVTVAANGSVAHQTGGAIHLYAANRSMEKHYFYNADGDLLIVPQEGELLIKTEFGLLELKPTEIAVIQRGIRFQVKIKSAQARGYICETYGAPFNLPDRGLIGANGLAEERHFQIPVAWHEEKQGDFALTAKFNGHLWQTQIAHSPLDVVAWHGNYAPYKYDLTLFNPVWSVHLDHSDPSIFTVLTSPTLNPGVANIDFVIFPVRWMVVEESFRPPYFHRNIMSEYMGLVHGEYDAKKGGFVPGGGSLHNCMSGHGPDQKSYEAAISAELKPHKYDATLAFMFESSKVWELSEFALNTELRQQDYPHCWQDLQRNYKTKG